MKRLLALLLIVCILLPGCKKKAPEPTEAPTTAPTTAPTEEAPTTEPTTVPTEPETEPVEPVEQSLDPLTGEVREDFYSQRPFAVVLNNDKKAMPHWGVADAQMVWEMPHEHNVTRVVAMYTDIGDVVKVGPTRSARPYLLSLCRSYNAIFVHAGHSTQAREDLKNTGWPSINGVEGKYAYKYFHRDQARLNAGIAMEHTMYTTGPEILSYAKDMAYGIAVEELVDYGYQFVEDGTPADGMDASTINITFKSGGKKTNVYYDETNGNYTVEQFGMPYMDGNDGSTVAFENVVILKAEVGILNDYGGLWVDLVGSGTGYYACGGKMVPILWSREGEETPLVYTLEDGTVLDMGIGTTFGAVIFEGEGTVYAS